MAKTPNKYRYKSEGWGAARGIATTAIPIAGQVSAYRGASQFAKERGAKKGVRTAAGVGAAAVGFVPGVAPVSMAFSGMRGVQKVQMHNQAVVNRRNGKTGIRTSKPAGVRTGGRVRRKG